jgi:hypothetical protein
MDPSYVYVFHMHLGHASSVDLDAIAAQNREHRAVRISAADVVARKGAESTTSSWPIS